jgi:hypothetical protein
MDLGDWLFLDMRILFDRLITPDTTRTRRLLLGSDWIARKISRGGNWNKIRIGLHYQFVDQGTNISGTPKLWIGMGNWLKGVGNYNAHFLGARTNMATWTRAVSNGVALFSSVAFTASKMVGQTETTSGSASFNIGTQQNSRRWLILVDIDKTTPSAVSVSVYTSNNTVSGIYDMTYDLFLDAMEQAVPANVSYTKSTISSTMTVDEATNGVLDSVNIGWSRTNFPIEIAGLAVGYYDTFS